MGLMLFLGALAQDKKCKTVKRKTLAGDILEMVQAGTRAGNFLMIKINDTTTVSYSTKLGLGLLAGGQSNMTTLRIDSVQFVFANNTTITLKAYAGLGKLENVNTALKPQLTSISYGVILPANSKEEQHMKSARLKAFRVIAEKSSQYGDLLNDKQQETWLEAFTCL
jgi:hypothetical protein